MPNRAMIPLFLCLAIDRKNIVGFTTEQKRSWKRTVSVGCFDNSIPLLTKDRMDGYINRCGSAVAKASWLQLREHRPTQKGIFTIMRILFDFVLWLRNCQQQKNISVSGIIQGFAFNEVFRFGNICALIYPLPIRKNWTL